jgi:hypothetical protein
MLVRNLASGGAGLEIAYVKRTMLFNLWVSYG